MAVKIKIIKYKPGKIALGEETAQTQWHCGQLSQANANISQPASYPDGWYSTMVHESSATAGQPRTAAGTTPKLRFDHKLSVKYAKDHRVSEPVMSVK